MSKKETAQQIVNGIKKQLDKTWEDSPVDVFNIGDPDTVVTGITTTYSPTIDVLKRSIATGNNLIISQQPAFYIDPYAPERGSVEEIFKNHPTYHYKKKLVDDNGLVIWRFYDNWNARKEDGQLLGLTKVLGWETYHLYDPKSKEPAYSKKNKYFMLPESTLGEMVTAVRNRLNIQGLRVVGDPSTKINKAAISHGMLEFTALQDILKDPEVSLIILAEAIEWESPEYFRDLLAWQGNNKGMILLGRQASEDPGYGEVALWLKTFIPQLPVEWIPAGEPFWIP